MSTSKIYPVNEKFIRIGRRSASMLYQPSEPSDRNDISIVIMHSDDDQLDMVPGPQLAARGYTVLCGTPYQGVLEQKLLAVKDCVEYLRAMPGINKVIISGHSGGATMMSAYQAVAENGAGIFQTPDMIYKCEDIGILPPADGLMLLDSNWGNGAMTLLSIDPAVKDETCGHDYDPELDIYLPANGYDPSGSHYSEEFVTRFQNAQGERMNRVIQRALDRLALIEQGKGRFADDEPFLVPGGSQFWGNNRLFPQDIRYLCRTKREQLLLHGDGTSTIGIVPSLRLPRPGQRFTQNLSAACRHRTVRTFLSNSSLWTDGFHYDDTRLYGCDFSRSFSCTPGNVRHVHAPAIMIGLTGGYECIAAEMIYDNCVSEDKTLAYIEGATHGFTPNREAEKTPGQFGDTVNTLADYLDTWLFTERFGK